MHQSAFLRFLAADKDNSVTLITEAAQEPGRSAQGWSTPDFGHCKIICTPLEEELRQYVADDHAIHVFTGLCAFPMVTHAFRLSCRIPGLHRLVYCEPLRNLSWKGMLRSCYYRWLALRYAGKLDALLLTGKLGVQSFRNVGFPADKCLEWGYFTEVPNQNETIPLAKTHTIPRLIFIGTWDRRKNILNFIQALQTVSLPYECLLLGGGVLDAQVKALVRNDNRFHIIGNVPNQQIGAWLSACDILVLPSIFDGWGAVVNEALLCGTRALVSDQCGASSLIESPDFGAVFALRNMASALEMQCKQGLQTSVARAKVKQWALEHISGEAAARRFMEICRNLLCTKENCSSK